MVCNTILYNTCEAGHIESSILLSPCASCLFIYLGFYVSFNTVQVISRWVVGKAEDTSTYSSLGFCTVNCQLMASNYQLSHFGLCREPNPSLRGGRQECYHSTTVAPNCHLRKFVKFLVKIWECRKNKLLTC